MEECEANELFISLIWSVERIFKKSCYVAIARQCSNSNISLDWLFSFNCLLDSREFNNASIHLIKLNKGKHKACTWIWPDSENRFQIHTITHRQLNYASKLNSSLWLQCWAVALFRFCSKVTRLTWHCSNWKKRCHPLYRFIEWAIFDSYLPNQFGVHLS